MSDTDATRIAKWLDPAAAVSATLSQRAQTSIEGHAGIKAMVAAARARRVHLIHRSDDYGTLLAASGREPVELLC